MADTEVRIAAPDFTHRPKVIVTIPDPLTFAELEEMTEGLRKMLGCCDIAVSAQLVHPDWVNREPEPESSDG